MPNTFGWHFFVRHPRNFSFEIHKLERDHISQKKYFFEILSFEDFFRRLNYFIVELSLPQGNFRGSEGIMKITHAPAGLRPQKTSENASRDQDFSLKKNPNEKYCLTKKWEQFFGRDLDRKISRFCLCLALPYSKGKVIRLYLITKREIQTKPYGFRIEIRIEKPLPFQHQTFFLARIFFKRKVLISTFVFRWFW